MVVLGLGARAGVPEGVLAEAVDAALAAAGLRDADVAVLATVDRRAAEEGVRAVAARRGWALRGIPAAELSRLVVPNPSEFAVTAMGTRSVAEAAALLVAGAHARILLPKRVSPSVTVAIVRGVPGVNRRA